MDHTDLNSPPKHSPAKKALALLVLVVVLVVAAVLGYLNWHKTRLNPLSEDATIGAELITIVPSLPGHIQDLYVKEGQKVSKGQLLFTIDPEFYEMRYQQAQAELAVAEAALATKKRLIQAQLHNASLSDEQIERARTNLQLTAQTQARLARLAPKGYVPQQQLDEATTLHKDAELSLKQAIEQSGAAEALVGTPDAEIAMVEVGLSGLAMAERSRRQTQVYAPDDGYVVGLNIAAGEYLLPEMSALTIVSAHHWYASAMYRENTLQYVEPGMCAEVYVMTNPDIRLTGRVQSIGWAVASDELIDLPRRAPYVPKSMNWVRVAQRFPVRIDLDVPPEYTHFVRKGVSATTIIHSDQQCD